eukprot:12457631-Ditylum_brightwellii.AAC.1
MPNIKHEFVLKQPETTRICFDVPDLAQGNNTREVLANIVPDKGLVGAEFALLYTFPEFEKRIKACLSSTTNNYVASLYDLMGRCFQGKDQSKWDKSVARTLSRMPNKTTLRPLPM